MTCRYCGTPLGADANPRRLYCSGSCRVKAHHRRKRDEEQAFRAAAADLLMRQSRAIQSDADRAVLADIESEARALFGDA